VEKTPEECGSSGDKEKDAREARMKDLQQQMRTLQIQFNVTDRTLNWLSAWADKVRSTPVNQAKSDPTFLTAPYIENVRNFGHFFAEETLKHTTRKAQLTKTLNELTQEFNHLMDEKRAWENRRITMKKFTTAVVSLAVKKATTLQFQLKYLVNGAVWNSAYDCRVSSEGTMCITYYGEIINFTNEDWNHTHLFLSTASPSVDGHPGELSQATVSICQPKMRFAKARQMVKKEKMIEEMDEMGCQMQMAACGGAANAPMAPMRVLTATSSKSLASCTFKIDRKATIACDGEEHRVTVTVIPDLPTKLTYVCAPSETDHVFLKASTVNKTEFPLLEGQCNTFIDGSFVASSRLKYTSIGEPFKFFLGTDKELRLKYTKPFRVDDKAGIIMKSAVQKFSGSIELRNGKSIAVNVSIRHPLPKADDSEIKVALAEPKIAKDSNAVKINAKNLIRWKQKVQPGEVFKMPIQYTVSYPQGRDVYFHN